MSLERRGFLPDFVDKQKHALRHAHQERFQLADRVSDMGQMLLPKVSTIARSRQNLLVCGLYVRGLQTLQGAILMAERGMVVEARNR